MSMDGMKAYTFFHHTEGNPAVERDIVRAANLAGYGLDAQERVAYLDPKLENPDTTLLVVAGELLASWREKGQ